MANWHTLYSRREILLRLSCLGVIAAGTLTLGPLAQYLLSQEDRLTSPLVTFNKQLETNSTWENVPNTRVWVKRDMKGVMALVATCTHLGCEVRYHPEENKWLCPCHASMYDGDGNVLSGPARMALPRVAVELKQDGSMIINTSKQVGIDARAS